MQCRHHDCRTSASPHDAVRRDMWQEPVPLRDKLYGNLDELPTTNAFVKAIGISVLRTAKKKKNCL